MITIEKKDKFLRLYKKSCLTRKELANSLGVSLRTIYYWIKEIETKNLIKKDNEMTELVTVEEKKGELVTTSLKVAEVFNKSHNHVLRDIRELGCDSEFKESNFGRILYKDSMNRNKKAYNITKDGFTLLVMGYSGTEAMQFKVKYIKSFNKMEENIRKANALIGSKSVKIIDAPQVEYYTVAGWEKRTKTILTSRMRLAVGKVASKICRE